MMMMMMMMSRAVRQSRNHDHMIFGHCRDVDYRQTDYAQNLCMKLIQYRFSDTEHSVSQQRSTAAERL